MKMARPHVLVLGTFLLTSCTISEFDIINYPPSIYSDDASFLNAISNTNVIQSPTGIPPYTLFENFVEAKHSLNACVVEYTNYDTHYILGYLANDIVKEVSDYAKELYTGIPTVGYYNPDESIIDGKLVTAYYKRKEMNLFTEEVADISWFDVSKSENIMYKDDKLTLGIILSVRNFKGVKNLHTNQILNINHKMLYSVKGRLEDDVLTLDESDLPFERIVTNAYTNAYWQEGKFESALVAKSELTILFSLKVINDMDYLEFSIPPGAINNHQSIFGKYAPEMTSMIEEARVITGESSLVSLDKFQDFLNNTTR